MRQLLCNITEVNTVCHKHIVIIHNDSLSSYLYILSNTKLKVKITSHCFLRIIEMKYISFFRKIKIMKEKKENISEEEENNDCEGKSICKECFVFCHKCH